MFFLFVIINFFFYCLILKFFYLIFKNKYIFPFRVAEIFTLISSLLIFSIISYKYFSLEIAVVTFIINFLFFVIFFFLLSMIFTSPRTKILIDTFEKKKLNKKKYLKYYDENKIVNNRIQRFKSNKEIILIKNNIKINNNQKRLTLLKLVIFVFQKMKEI